MAGPQVDATATRTPRPSLIAGPHIGLPGTGATVSPWMLVLDGLVLVAGAWLVLAACLGRSLV